MVQAWKKLNVFTEAFYVLYYEPEKPTPTQGRAKSWVICHWEKV
jgi:hypothetical protein